MNIQDTMTIIGLGKGKGYVVMTDIRYQKPHLYVAHTRTDLLEYLIIHLEAPAFADNVKIVEAMRKYSGEIV